MATIEGSLAALTIVMAALRYVQNRDVLIRWFLIAEVFDFVVFRAGGNDYLGPWVIPGASRLGLAGAFALSSVWVVLVIYGTIRRLSVLGGKELIKTSGIALLAGLGISWLVLLLNQRPS